MVDATDKLDMLNFREDKSVVKSLDANGTNKLTQRPSC
jgi:hypothetical protein